MTEPTERRAWRTDAEWTHLRERIEGAELAGPPRRNWRLLRAIAAALVFAAAAGVGWKLRRSKEAEVRVATTAAGERVVIRLADSSVVTLGPASRVRYAIGARQRDVELDGLADFAVVHDAARPFVVRSRNAVTTDLGTRFVVRAYDSDSAVEVAVTEGHVAVSGAPATAAVELHAGDVAQVRRAGAPLLAQRRDAAAKSAWVDGRLVFDNEPLARVVADLSRWFDADIRVAGGALEKRTVSAVYNDASLSDVLAALAATLGARVERSGRTVVISVKGS